jgi:hypothetical protein
MDRVVAFLAYHQRFAPTACHHAHPCGRIASAFPGQVGEFADVMDFYRVGATAKLTFLSE